MATWKSENSLLTLKGIEILNKIKVGVGKITISRVVAGSGRVEESFLHAQTSVSGAQRVMVLSKSVALESGSEISVYITNEGFTEEFDINQIGVYVTHPDYDGEVLYHIAQCDANTHDTIPVLDDTPITLGYSLYLEHGNSSSIEIVVDPLGMISRVEFDKFTKNTVVGNIFTIDENRNLIDTGIPVSRLGTSSKNLLHNWYFRDPVDTKQGRIAISGTPYFSDTKLASQIGTLTTAVTATYVNGNYCTIVVNNTTYYVRTSLTKYGYLASVSGVPSIDRWSLTKGNSNNGHIELDYNGATLNIGYGKGVFSQNLAEVTNAFMFGGHTYTFSAKVLSVSGGTPVITFDNGETNFEVPITKPGIVSVTAYVAEDAGALVVGISNNHLSENSIVQVSAVKLEIGTMPTLENDPPADYAEQMAICIQFNPNTGMYRGFPTPVTANVLAQAFLTE